MTPPPNSPPTAPSAASHELDSPPWLRVEATLMATARQINEIYDSRLGSIGLSLTTASLLAYVDQFGPVTQTRAAEHLGQGRASTGTQVDRLERDGLLRRVPDPADRRVWLLETTAVGQRRVAELLKIDRALRHELRQGISRAERQQLAELLLRLQTNLAAAPGCGGDPSTNQPNHQHQLPERSRP